MLPFGQPALTGAHVVGAHPQEQRNLAADLNLTHAAVNERDYFSVELGPTEAVRRHARQHGVRGGSAHAALERANELGGVTEIIVPEAVGYGERVLQEPHEKMRLVLNRLDDS